ncbi:hypothetical protein FJ365_03590 [Candidatus Dependentiae bacterium]|nr:hypothetical protein [Candidatus Dependentiae bacterium]
MNQVCLVVHGLALLLVVAAPVTADAAALPRVTGKALSVVELESLFADASIGVRRPFTSSTVAQANPHFVARMQRVNYAKLKQYTKCDKYIISTATFVDAVYRGDLQTMRAFLAGRLKRIDQDAACFFDEIERNVWWDEALVAAAMRGQLDAINLLLAFRKIVCERMIDKKELAERASACLSLEVFDIACKKQQPPSKMGISIEQYYKEQLGEIAKKYEVSSPPRCNGLLREPTDLHEE